MDSGFISMRLFKRTKTNVSKLKARKMLATGRKVTDADILDEAVADKMKKEENNALAAVDALAGLWKDKSDAEVNALIDTIYEERKKPWRSI